MREGTKRKCLEASLLQLYAKAAKQGFIVHAKVAKAAFSCSSGRGFAISACFFLCEPCVKPHERRDEEELSMEASLLQVHAKAAKQGFIVHAKVAEAALSCSSGRGFAIFACFFLCDLCVKPHERRNEEEVYGDFFASGSRKVR